MFIINAVKTWFDTFGYINILVSIISGTIPFVIYIKFILKKERRLFNNLKRKIYVIKVINSQNDTQYIDLLSSVNWFNVHERSINISDNINNLHSVNDKAFLVVLYSEEAKQEIYQKIIDFSLNKNIPTIFYSNEDIKGDLYKEIKLSPKIDTCRTKTRLLTQIFNISAVIPND